MTEFASGVELRRVVEPPISNSHYSFFCDLLEGCLNDQQIKQRASKLSLTNLPNIVINIYLNPLQSKNSNSNMKEKNKLLEKTISLSKQIFKYWDGASILNYRGKIVVLLPRSYRDLELMKSEIKTYINQLIHLICFKEGEKLSLIAGVGQYYDYPSMIHLSYSEANCAAQAYFLHGNQVIFFDELEEKRNMLNSLYLFESEQKLLERVCIGDAEAAQKKLNEMINTFGHASNEDFLNNLFVFLSEQMVILSRGVLMEGAEPESVSEIKRKLTKELILTNNFEQVQTWIKKMIESFIELIKEKDPKPSAHIVNEAEKYIKDHYQYHLSLDDVATKVHVSPAYLSRIFKEERNESFVRYLMKVRIEHAKRLLSKTNLEIGSIASKVGFRNQNYFTTVFRKQEGITPTDFRNKINNFKLSANQ